MTRRVDDRGAATVLVVTMAGVLLLLGSALAVAAALVVGHRTAQAAADLAALAGAQTLADGGEACAAAATVARANGATVLRCVVDGPDVLVIVQVTGPRWLGQQGDLRAQARAGPDPSTLVRAR